MVCLPLIERELRVATRKQRPARTRLLVAAVAVAASLGFILLGTIANARDMGRFLEQFLCLAGVYAVISAPSEVAGVLAEERRNQTLGLLFISGLSAWEVFTSKFLSATLVAFTRLLAVFPMLAVPFLMGGVSFDLFLATTCELPVLMLLALALTLLASALTRDEGSALVLASVLAAVLCALAPAVYLAQSHFAPGSKPSLWWLRLSPAYGAHLLWTGFSSGFRSGKVTEFWFNLSVTLGWIGILVVSAAVSLKRLWREREADAGAAGWRGLAHRLLHGGREYRDRLARQWLDVYPYAWLAGRDRTPQVLLFLVSGGIVAVWLACYAAWPTRWPSVPNFLLTALLLNTALAWLSRFAAAREFAVARREGVYELLLTTPLEPLEIVSGALMAARGMFGTVANLLLVLDGVLCAVGLAMRSWNPAALAVYAVAWLGVMTWTWTLGHWWRRLIPCMWAGLNCGLPVRAVQRVSGLSGWSLLWVGFYASRLGPRFRQFPTGSKQELWFAGLFLLVWLVVAFVRWMIRRFAEGKVHAGHLKWDAGNMSWSSEVATDPAQGNFIAQRMIREFREVVREPLPDPQDPRFKQWNALERFPQPQWVRLPALKRKAVEARNQPAGG